MNIINNDENISRASFHYSSTTSIFIGVITCAKNKWKAEDFERWYQRYYTKDPRVYFSRDKFDADIPIIKSDDNVIEDFNTFSNDIEENNLSVEMLAGLIKMCEYFLLETDLLVMWRAMDDTLIVPKNYEKLKFSIDPQEIHVHGHCFQAPEGYPRVSKLFNIQGGTGFLITRRAVEIFYKIRYDLAKNIAYHDDWIYPEVMGKFVPRSEMSSKYFVGTFRDVPDIYKPDKYSICERNTWHCNSDTVKFADIAALHYHKKLSRSMWSDLVSRSPNNLHIYIDIYFSAGFCRKNSTQ